MNYNNPYILVWEIWNNAFSYKERTKKKWKDPTLTIPSLKYWTLEDIEVGEDIVFEELEDGILKSCKWLKQFIRLRDQESQSITIFDNHNHALYFWVQAIYDWLLSPWFELIHIDEHSDLWENKNTLDKNKALHDAQYIWEFTNFSCNVGNYIPPAIESWIVGKIIRIENEFQLNQYEDYSPWKNTVLNIDLDFFSQEMEFIPEEKKLRFIRKLLKNVECITIATSPYFIDQWIALKKLKKMFSTEIQ